MITSLTVLSEIAIVTASQGLTLSQTSSSATISPPTGTAVIIPEATSGLTGLAGLLDSTRATIIDSLPAVATSGSYTDLTNLPSLGWAPNFIIDGGGLVITTGEKGFIQIGVPVTLTGWALMADQSGSLALDIWKIPSTSFPPTVANSIVAGSPPALVSQQYATGLVVGPGGSGGTGWTTTAFNVNDILAFNVNSAATVQRVTLFLYGVHS